METIEKTKEFNKFQKTLSQNNALATIKKPGEKETITKDEYEYRLNELAKCKRDIVYFAENYYKIINLDRGLETIKLFDVQKDLLKFIKDNNRAVILASRQSGKCVYSDTFTTVRNKKTGEISKISLIDLFNVV